MHLSKKVLYLGIIGYSVALLIFQDWPAMISTTGFRDSGPWLAKMGIDALFMVGAMILWVGPALFADDEDSEDEIALHKEELPISDGLLFGLFLVDVAMNFGFHAYQAIETESTVSFYYSIWTLSEFFLLPVVWVLFLHARKIARRAAKKARDAARAAGSQPIGGRNAA